MFLSVNYNSWVAEFTLLTSYQKSLAKLVDCFKSYELREGSTVIEVKEPKTGCTWKLRICCDMEEA
jgi:hypothetical protein